jgi:hypothetical protein
MPIDVSGVAHKLGKTLKTISVASQFVYSLLLPIPQISAPGLFDFLFIEAPAATPS